MHWRFGRAVRRFAVVWLALLLIAGTSPGLVLAEESPQPEERPSTLDPNNDVPGRAFYLDAVAFLTDLGIIGPEEDGAFVPNRPITRAEFAAWLARALGLDPAPGSPFSDVPASSAEAPYIHALFLAGIVHGYGDGSFRGDRPVTRAEAAAMLAAGLSLTPVHAAAFADVRETDWFAGAVGALANLRAVAGKAQGRFAPGDPLTRGEAAVLICRAVFSIHFIEDLDAETVTISGRKYRWAESLSGLFGEINRAALLGSAIQFETDGDTIVSVSGLEIRAVGSEAQDEARDILFDAGGAVIDGHLLVAADAAVIRSVHIRGSLIVMGRARDGLLLDGSVAEGGVVTMPAAADTGEYVFLVSGSAIMDRFLVFRDIALFNLDGMEEAASGAGAASVFDTGIAAGAAKSPRPVTVSQLSDPDELEEKNDYYDKLIKFFGSGGLTALLAEAGIEVIPEEVLDRMIALMEGLENLPQKEQDVPVTNFPFEDNHNWEEEMDHFSKTKEEQFHSANESASQGIQVIEIAADDDLPNIMQWVQRTVPGQNQSPSGAEPAPQNEPGLPQDGTETAQEETDEPQNSWSRRKTRRTSRRTARKRRKRRRTRRKPAPMLCHRANWTSPNPLPTLRPARLISISSTISRSSSMPIRKSGWHTRSRSKCPSTGRRIR